MPHSRPTAQVSRVRYGLFGLIVAGVALGSLEGALRLGTAPKDRPPPLDRFALADVATGAYVHRRDATAGDWLEVTADRVRTRPARQMEGIARVDVSRTPAPGVHRVVALGGSTTRGVPFDHKGGGFVAELSTALDAAAPGRFEVVNLGVPGMDARGVAKMAREARVLGASTWLVYTGNNEVVGDLLDRCVHTERVWMAQTLDHLLAYRMLRTALLGPPVSPTTADALAAQQTCMSTGIATAWSSGTAQTGAPLDPVHAPGVARPLPRTDTVSLAVKQRLEHALDDILASARAADASVLLALPATNLLHPPEHVLAGPGRTSEDASAVDTVVAAARRQKGPRGLALWTEALQIDPHRADALHGWGSTRLALGGNPTSAKVALRAAIDHDYSARRPTSEVRASLRSRCDRPDVTCLDLDALIGEETQAPVVPAEWFADHCHPSELGTQRIGALVARSLLAFPDL